MAGLKLLHDGKIIFSGNADSMGYKRLRIPEARDNLKPISLRIETSESYPAWQEIIEVPKGISSKTISLYQLHTCLLYTSPSPRDVEESRMPSSA